MATTPAMFEKLQFNAQGSGDAGEWTDVSLAQDVTVTMEAAEANATTRGSAGFRNTEPTIIDITMEFDILYDPDGEDFQALKDAFMDRSLIGLQALDEDGGEGVIGDFKIFKFNQNEPLDGLHTISVTAKVCRSDTPPDWTGGT
jgi:hypothetical protein